MCTPWSIIYICVWYGSVIIIRRSISKIVGYASADWMPNGIEKVIYFRQLTFFGTSFSQRESARVNERPRQFSSPFQMLCMGR